LSPPEMGRVQSPICENCPRILEHLVLGEEN